MSSISNNFLVWCKEIEYYAFFGNNYLMWYRGSNSFYHMHLMRQQDISYLQWKSNIGSKSCSIDDRLSMWN